MENENTNKVQIKNNTELADNLKFMRSIIEKTYRSFDQGSPLFIVFGLIFLLGLPATQYLVKTPQLKEFVQPMWIILWVIGAGVAIFNGLRCEIREKKTGHISQLSNQIGFIWYILLLNASIWSIGPFSVFLGKQAFLWAAIFGFGLSIEGILSSKEWLFGGVAILVSILVASIIKGYAYVILGIAIGLGCIIPAIITRRNYIKKEKSYE